MVMMESIIELAANKVPITLKSLKNSFDTLSESKEYSTFLAFRGSVAGGWIKIEYKGDKYTIFFISSKDMGKMMRQYDDKEEVIIVDIDRTDKNCMTEKILYINEDYCLK